MNEKDLIQKLKEDAEHITPPASLQPDAIEQMLLSRQQKEKTSKGRHKKKTTIRYRRIAQLGSIAAVFALAFIALRQSELIGKISKNENSAAIQTEWETAAPQAEPAQGAPASQAESAQDAPASQAESAQDAPASQAESAQDAPASQAESAQEAYGDMGAGINDSFTYAASYEEIYNELYKNFYSEDSALAYSRSEYGAYATAEVLAEDSVADTGASVPSAISGSGQNTSDFSTTNLQELGVDEGDIVKTDGNYIYILRQDSSLAILKANGKDSQIASITEIAHNGNTYAHEMYLDGTTLNIIISEYITSLDNEADVYFTNSKRQTKLLTYDISDPGNPVLSGTVAQDGSYEDSRKNGQYLYLFTSYYPDIQGTYEESTIIPRINGSNASADDFYLPDSLRDRSYLVISSINTASPGEILDSKILVSGVSNFYVSTDNIYIANEQYLSSQTRTEITKFHYEDGIISGAAAGSVTGYLNNSFSMNEYNGMLRVVSTYYGDEYNNVRDFVSNFTGEYYEQNWTEHNALYVLDESLQQIGAIEGLAEGETIRSARFFGDTGYFVTFRQTDPLFSVDLSDPASPQILGELKISGFSSYLHFYGEDLLLGIGYEADEETGITSGLKLSMFDISNPADVTEIHRFVLPGITWCPAIEDYKSILAEPEKNLIGFYCDNRYLVFSYDAENGFTQELIYDFYSDLLTDQAGYNTMRGLYINDTFYLAGSTFLIPFDMEDGFTKTGLIEIR